MKFWIWLVRFSLILLAGIVAFLIVSYGILFFVPARSNKVFHNQLKSSSISANEKNLPDNSAKLKKEVNSLNTKLEKLSPGKVYIVINTTDNTFKLYKNGTLVRSGNCSTGSYIEMEVDGKKTYRFETPKGVHTVKNKRTKPVWTKPDWAFIEEGLPVPSAHDPSRYEKNVLGDYALDIGNQYMIHGTLYQRFLGQPVTHGCVRLDDADLEFVYNEMQIGSKVFIY
jgi:hypothetical protein